jgi:hypothetical protein
VQLATWALLLGIAVAFFSPRARARRAPREEGRDADPAAREVRARPLERAAAPGGGKGE